MAISTHGVTLMKGAGSPTTYSKLVDIKAFPDMGAAPQTIETTTLSDAAQTFVNGVETTAALEFTANYSVTDYTTLIGLKNTKTPFALQFGTETTSSKFTFDGYLSAWVVGGGVNGVVEMRISILPSSPIVKA